MFKIGGAGGLDAVNDSSGVLLIAASADEIVGWWLHRRRSEPWKVEIRRVHEQLISKTRPKRRIPSDHNWARGREGSECENVSQIKCKMHRSVLWLVVVEGAAKYAPWPWTRMLGRLGRGFFRLALILSCSLVSVQPSPASNAEQEAA
jgi:hypothetical protein